MNLSKVVRKLLIVGGLLLSLIKRTWVLSLVKKQARWEGRRRANDMHITCWKLLNNEMQMTGYFLMLCVLCYNVVVLWNSTIFVVVVDDFANDCYKSQGSFHTKQNAERLLIFDLCNSQGGYSVSCNRVMKSICRD